MLPTGYMIWQIQIEADSGGRSSISGPGCGGFPETHQIETETASGKVQFRRPFLCLIILSVLLGGLDHQVADQLRETERILDCRPFCKQRLIVEQVGIIGQRCSRGILLVDGCHRL